VSCFGMEAMKRVSFNVLVIDDDVMFGKSIERSLRDEFNVSVAVSPERAHPLLWQADAVLLDVVLDESDPQDRMGLTLLTQFHRERPQVPIIIMTAYGNTEMAVEAMKSGAVDFLPKPLDLVKLKTTLRNVLRQAQLINRLGALEGDLHRIEPVELVGRSEKVSEIRTLIDYIAADGYVSVLVTGETGTGKELVARLIHERGWRSEGPFVPLSLAALPVSIIERELFGHEKGAFTDAKGSEPGYIEQANKGVLFLDDIDAASLEVQVKLLRFLEQRSFFRLGSTRPISVDLQVISATNHDLMVLMKEKKFRQDLYYRINALQIYLPPLRERADDIPILAEHFLALLRRQGRSYAKTISKEAFDAMAAYQWPGNVRELRNAVEKAALISSFKRREMIELQDLPIEVQKPRGDHDRGAFPVCLADNGVDLEKEKARLELSYIEEALRKTGGRKAETWKLLGLNDRFALRRRVKKLMEKHPELISDFPLTERAFIHTMKSYKASG